MIFEAIDSFRSARRIAPAFLLVVCFLFFRTPAVAEAVESSDPEWPESAVPGEVAEHLTSYSILHWSPGIPQPDCTLIQASLVDYLQNGTPAASKDQVRDLLRSSHLAGHPEGLRPTRLTEGEFRSSVPLRFYLITGTTEGLEEAVAVARMQCKRLEAAKADERNPARAEDMFFVASLQSRAFRATTNQLHLDAAANYVVRCIDALQLTNGLFAHAPEAPVPWGQANGWAAMGMTELLEVLPETHPDRDRIMGSYQLLMGAVRDLQMSNGYWHQIVGEPGTYKEPSATALLTCAMKRGIKRRWLSGEGWEESARAGWIAVAQSVDQSGMVYRSTVPREPSNRVASYLNAPVIKGDSVAQACALWCAMAFLD